MSFTRWQRVSLGVTV